MKSLLFLLAFPLAAQTIPPPPGTATCVPTWTQRGCPAQASIPLEGTWQFRLDAEKSGLEMKWHQQRFQGDTIFLPGSTDQAGYGLKLSAASRGWLSRPYIYEGPAWYQREITIPEAWRGQHVRLFLERPHWETRAWLDGRDLGTQNSLSTPHIYDLGINLTPGRHIITLLIDNTLKIDVGRNAHSVTEHTQTNWNGVVGRLELQATPPVWIDRVRLTATEAQITIRNTTNQTLQGTLQGTV